MRSTPGTATAATGPGRRAGCATTNPRRYRCAPGSGQCRSTDSSTTPTDAPCGTGSTNDGEALPTALVAVIICRSDADVVFFGRPDHTTSAVSLGADES